MQVRAGSRWMADHAGDLRRNPLRRTDPYAYPARAACHRRGRQMDQRLRGSETRQKQWCGACEARAATEWLLPQARPCYVRRLKVLHQVSVSHAKGQIGTSLRRDLTLNAP